MNRNKLKNLKGKLIISCQAYEDNPLYGTDNMVTLAKCAIAGGAAALRLCWPDAICSVRKITDFPIIGINKVINPINFDMYQDVFITPNYEAAVDIIEAGCDIVALDGTLRNRTEEELGEMIGRLKQNYPHILLMADIATIEEGILCERVGFDIVSSTLSGYTEETRLENKKEPDYHLIRQLKKETGCLVNAEGRIWSREHLRKVHGLEPDMITIGTAVTNPMKITEYFNEELLGTER